MAESRRLVKVFLASPGDLADERKAAKLVIDEFNALLAEEFGYQVELVGWEDTVSVFGRPQAIINRELARCELFIGMMWKHWGTAPDTSGPYSSGFEEEYKRSVERRLSDGRPEISLFFKEIDPEFIRDPGEGLKRVLAFKSVLIAEKLILFENFSDIRDFEMKIRRCITRYIRNLRAEDLATASGHSQSPTTDGEEQQVEEANRPNNTPLSPEGANFLREFISRTECITKDDPLSGVEIARFRLLTTIIKTHGNDDLSLGSHDANLLFRQGRHFKFGLTEIHGLLAAGLDHFSNQNVPFWHWLAAIDGFSNNMLPIYSLIESPARRVNALTAMKLISEPLPTAPTWDRNTFLNSWLAADATNALKVAALTYLGECGITSDLTIIRQELDKNDNQTNSVAAEALIRITLRESRNRAIVTLYELQPTTVSADVLAMVFCDPDIFTTETLMDGVGHRNPRVRQIVVKLLSTRQALPTDIAEQLLADSDATVRCEALEFLVRSGRFFSEEEAKKILIKPTPSTGIAFPFGASDRDGEACWAHFRQLRLRSLREKELEDLANDDPLLDPVPKMVLVDRHFNKRGDELRKAVGDQYKQEFAKWFDDMTKNFTGKPELLQKARSLENSIRKDLTRKSLDLICQKAERRDLRLVREVVKSGFVEYSEADIEYLRQFGEWEDIPLIVESLQRPKAGQTATLLSIPDTSRYKVAARAIYALGRSRLNEILTMQATGQLLSYVVVEVPDKAFRDLSDLLIIRLLRSEPDTLRKATALKSIRAFSKKRILKLQNEYISGDGSYYYNVIHWLDLGISASRNRVLSAAEKVLKKEW
jgi:hypothetical protein